MKITILYLAFVSYSLLHISCNNQIDTHPNIPNSKTLKIVSIQPTSIKIGDVLTINGTGFGDSQSSSIVKFNSINASEYLFWNDFLIQVRVPVESTSGKLSITVNGKNSNEVDFTIISSAVAPHIYNLQPTSAKIGDLTAIYGTDFGDSQGSNYVSFNTIHVSEYLSWSKDYILAKVPTGAISGQVTVTVSGMKSNEIGFIITSPENNESVKIGNQIWMLKNLNVDHYRNGDPIPEVTDATAWKNLTTGAWCYNNNDPNLGVLYGKLYNWYAVNDIRGLAPEGWHVASDAEWTSLVNYLGGGSIAGGKLKETGTNHWHTPNTGATNESGFTALPGGYRDANGSFNNVSDSGLWWTSPNGISTNTKSRFLHYSYGNIYTYIDAKGGGFSIRCIKD